MSRTVFAQCNAIVSQYEYRLNSHECCHTDGRTQKVSKYQEGTTEGNEAAMQGNTV